jgi:hypothetical protein
MAVFRICDERQHFVDRHAPGPTDRERDDLAMSSAVTST